MWHSVSERFVVFAGFSIFVLYRLEVWMGKVVVYLYPNVSPEIGGTAEVPGKPFVVGSSLKTG